MSTRILVVDDNLDAGEALAELLALLDFDARHVCSADAALSRLESFQPLAIICDLAMPGMDGYEFARSLRGKLSGDTPLLVAYSGCGTAEDIRRSASAGFQHHLTKPVALEELLRVLQAVGDISH